MPDLDAIRRRLAAATPRPWFYNSYNGVESDPMIAADAAVENAWASAGMPELTDGNLPEPWRSRFRESEPKVCWVPPSYGDTATGRHRADAELIAHAPDDIKALLALVEAQAERIADLERALEAARLPHADDWGETCPRVVQARVDRCLTCKYKGRPECVCPCTCIAEAHNAAIDKTLKGEG